MHAVNSIHCNSQNQSEFRSCKIHSTAVERARGVRVTRAGTPARVCTLAPRVTLDHALRAVIHSLALNQKRAQWWRTLHRLEALGLNNLQHHLPPLRALALRVFPAHLSPFLCFELHFPGSALCIVADCLGNFGGQPRWLRSPAPARYLAICTFLQRPWGCNCQRRRVSPPERYSQKRTDLETVCVVKQTDLDV